VPETHEETEAHERLEICSTLITSLQQLLGLQYCIVLPRFHETYMMCLGPTNTLKWVCMLSKDVKFCTVETLVSLKSTLRQLQIDWVR
jgi:hypothetical protein